MEKRKYKSKMWTTEVMDAILHRAPVNEIKQLLDSGHDPDEVYNNKGTALHVLVSSSANDACSTDANQKYYSAVLELLFKRVKIVTPVNDFGHTPLKLGMFVGVPVKLMVMFICLWSKKVRCSPIMLYFNECANCKNDLQIVKAILKKGGGVYPLKRSRRDIQKITTLILNNICGSIPFITSFMHNISEMEELLTSLFQAGLDISNIDREHKWLENFVDFVINQSKSDDDIPVVLQYFILCGGQNLLSHICKKYFIKEKGIPLHGPQMLKFNIYVKVSALCHQTLSLQSLAARQVRINLRPNSWIGVHRLQCIETLQGYIGELPVILKELITLCKH